MDFREPIRHFHDDGFVVLRGFLASDEQSSLLMGMEQVVREVAPSLGKGTVYHEDAADSPIKSMFRLEQHNEVFRKLQQHPRLRGLVQTVYDDPDMAMGTIMYFGKAARAGSLTPPHQDNFYQCFNPPEALRITIAIDASTPGNGPLTCQKGSHLLGVLPHEPSNILGFSQVLRDPPDEERYPRVELCMEPGDICLHATNTVHYSRPNTTDHPRRQLAIECHSTRARQDEHLLARRRAVVEQLHRQTT